MMMNKTPILCFKNIEGKPIEDLIQLAETTGIIGDNPVAFWERYKVIAHLDIANKECKIRTCDPKYSSEDTKEFKIQISELLEQKSIRNSNSPYRSASFMVRNRAEQVRGKARLVINYKRLNDNTIDYGYKIPIKDMFINKIQKANWFSKFNCKSGFWQIKMCDCCRSWTALFVQRVTSNGMLCLLAFWPKNSTTTISDKNKFFFGKV